MKTGCLTGNVDCILLGAGASVCAKAPLISDFKQTAELVAETLPTNFGHSGGEVFKNTVRYWTSNFPHLNVEEFYVMAELQQILESGNPIAGAGALGFADCVQSMIAKTLAVRMRGPPHKAHASLASKVGKSGASVLTLNWDLALDNAFDRAKVAVGLGFGDAFDMGTGQRLSSEKPSFLKLHGSLNWWFCYNGHLMVQRAEKSVADAWDVPPPPCPLVECQPVGAKLRPLMVPPTSQKLLATSHAGFLRPIWKRAYAELSGADRVVFVGYSFPSTDVQFRTFVQRALLENKTLKRVEVVSNRKFGSEKVRFEDHYGGILQPLPAGVKVEFNYDGFETWVEGY